MGSGAKVFTAGEVLTASDMNTYLSSRVVAKQTTVPSASTPFATPEAGSMAYYDSGDANEGLYIYTGTTWNKGPGWNAPWGLLAKASFATTNVTSSTHTTLQDGNAALTVTATTITNRIYKVTTSQNPYASGGANGFQGSHMVGGVAQAAFLIPALSTTTQDSRTWTSTYTETAGASRIFKAQIAAYTTNTAVTDWGSATIPRIIIVEDIGPSGAPN